MIASRSASLEVGEALQRVEIGAQARERGAQLVPGVLYQPMLFLLRAIATPATSGRTRRSTAPTSSPPGSTDRSTSSRPVVSTCSAAVVRRRSEAVTRLGDPEPDQRRRGGHQHDEQQRAGSQAAAADGSVSSSDRPTWTAPLRKPDRSHPIVAGRRLERGEHAAAGWCRPRAARRRSAGSARETSIAATEPSEE